MISLYAASLVPILAFALYLFFSATLRGKNARVLALYCLAVVAWCAALLLVFGPATSALAQRFVVIGSFMVASFLHVAYQVIGARDLRLVWLAYAVAAGITALSAAFPGRIYDPLSLQAGPMFWPTMVLAIAANAFPALRLYRAYREAGPERRPLIRRLLIAGLLSAFGGLTNTLLLSHGHPWPIGLLFVLASLFVLAEVVRQHESRASRTLLERSFVYACLGAVWTAAVTITALAIFGQGLSARPLELFFVVAMAALAFAPLEQHLLERLSARLHQRAASAGAVAEALEVERDKSEHAERLAEVGTLVSAVAHEVRNPLGVLRAHLALLERRGADHSSVEAMKAEIDRASRFVDDLLRFGRPRPLELRLVDLPSVVDLAWSSAGSALGKEPPVELVRAVAPEVPLLEADQGQLLQVLVIVLENAILAAREGTRPAKVQIEVSAAPGGAEICVEDSGPGIPAEIAPRLFQPFISGRKREGQKSGNGLGLATARRIVERHGGSIAVSAGTLGGARFRIALPDAPRAVEPTAPG